MQLFITGTDTSVGKTVVAAILTLGCQGYYWKPIQSGAQEGTDCAWVQSVTEIAPEHCIPEVYSLQAPLSPHAAAALEGAALTLDCIPPLPALNAPLFIEGAGGVLVPLNERELIIDLIKRFKIPALVVARSGLGTINHTLLTLAQLRAYAIPIFGVVLNGPLNPGNRQAIEFYGQVPVVAELPVLDSINKPALLQAFKEHFSYFQVKV